MKNLIKLTLLAGLVALPGLASANYGRVLYVRGDVTVTRADVDRRLVRGARVRQGDVIETGGRGRAHIRMADRTLLSLRPDTRFEIEEYSYEPPAVTPARAAAQAPSVAQAGSGRSFYRLLKGGFRSITGLIGKADRSAFGIRTSVATIGIRGTTTDVACLRECLDGAAARVLDGSIIITTEAGSIILADDEIGFAGGLNLPPQRLTEPPPELLDDEAPPNRGRDNRRHPLARFFARRNAADRDRSDPTRRPGQRNAEQRDTVTEETESPTPRERRDIAYATGPFGAETAGDAIAVSIPAVLSIISADGELEAFTGSFPAESGQRAAVYSALPEDPFAHRNVGFDPDTGVRWGRYEGGSVRVESLTGGAETTIPLAGADGRPRQGFHWAAGPLFEGEVALPSTGGASFVLGGNTDPTNNRGQVGVVGSMQLSADFVAGTVASDVSLAINQRVWTASGSGSLGAALSADTPSNVFAGSYDSVAIGGVPGGDGSFSGFMTEQAAGAGMSYVLSNPGASEIVSGAASFRRAGAVAAGQ